MLFRIIGLILIGLGVVIIWLLKPARDGSLRVPKRYEVWVSLFVTGIIGIGIPLLSFGAPEGVIGGGGQ